MEKISRSDAESVPDSRVEMTLGATKMSNTRGFKAIKQKKLEALIKENVPRSGSTRRLVTEKSQRDDKQQDK